MMIFDKNVSLSLLYRTSSVAFILLFLVQGRDAVLVECRTSLAKIVNECNVGTATTFSTIRVVSQEHGTNCIENSNYYLALNGTSSYVWVLLGCSGVFEVDGTSTSVTWGSWGPCSVSCGAGTRRRERSCSTGKAQDCLSLGDWNRPVMRSCYMGVCNEPRQNAPRCGFTPRTYRVVGGQDAGSCEFPWMAMVHKPAHNRRCGGTIVDQTHILTAAHCLSIFDKTMLRSFEDKPDTLAVYTGSSYMPLKENERPDTIPGLQQHKVTNVHVHQDFNPFTLANDIAILTLSKPIVYGRCNAPLCQINSSMSVYDQDVTQCKTMGWGKTNDPKTVNGTNHLQWTSVDIVPEVKCRQYYTYNFHPNNFCAGGNNGRDACGGDSGGPLICRGPWDRYYQYGIVSSGSVCGQIGGMYTHLQKYTQWLEQHLN